MLIRFPADCIQARRLLSSLVCSYAMLMWKLTARVAGLGVATDARPIEVGGEPAV